MPFGATKKFLKKLEEFATVDTARGRPKNESLVANIHELRLTILQELWQGAEPFPGGSESRWWEVWFTADGPGEDPSGSIAAAVDGLGLRMAPQTLAFPDRTVALVRGTSAEVSGLLTTNALVAELHPPATIREVFGISRETRLELVGELARLLEPADDSAPAVCLLDTGVNAGHRLLRASVDATLTALPGTTPADRDGHGTGMAGLALFGDLRSHLVNSQKVELTHRLESVKVFDPRSSLLNAEPQSFGIVTAAAASAVEIEVPERRRVYSMPITAVNLCDGRPTSWSAAVDALAFGTDIGQSERGVKLLGTPDPAAARLFLISAGNVRDTSTGSHHLDRSDLAPIEEPAQAWNALTVGACTDLTQIISPQFCSCRPVALAGELSPYSRTSVQWDGAWPIKPDIVLEGGNQASDASGFCGQIEDLDLLTTRFDGDLESTRATSPATAQAARLGALVLARYPRMWPETIRGLLVHAAEWTPPMRGHIMQKRLKKAERVRLLRRYGWGVPTEERVLTSAADAVTMIVEDKFIPFEPGKSGVSIRALRIHDLPWPRETLLDLFDVELELRITLSYFVEPNPSNRGWGSGYRYSSHQLRFDLKQPTETVAAFENRVGRQAQQEEENASPTLPASQRGADKRWLVGSAGRSRGSLHSDVWTGPGQELAECGRIAVVPIGGWWKDNKRMDRIRLPVRYALLVSLKAKTDVDVYTPIASQIGIETSI
jgi:hypothetical protein